MASRHILPTLLCIGLTVFFPMAVSGLAAADTASPRALPSGIGPFLPSLDASAAPPGSSVAAKAASGEVYVDLPCDLFDPGKADPRNWMATATLAQQFPDGVHAVYGYDPLAQTYDLMVSGYTDASTGILLQETVGVLAVALPDVLTPTNVRRVELWFHVDTSNLFPFEGVGITALETAAAPSSSLNAASMQALYEDARGFSGKLYFLDHLTVGAHAIDLGTDAAIDLAGRVGFENWFGVGLAADGWDLSGSPGELVQWRVDGGGSLPVENRPFFRVHYNAPPEPFALTSPYEGQVITTPTPTLVWDSAIDPNGDTPIEYRVRLGTDPTLTTAFEMNAATATTITLPFALAASIYYWEVVATDPDGAQRASERLSFVLTSGPTAVDTPALSTRLTVQPNPANPRAEIRFVSPRGGTARVFLTDLLGRRVRSLFHGTLSAGTHRWVWSGDDERGASCASGVYHVVVDQAGRRTTARVSLVR